MPFLWLAEQWARCSRFCFADHPIVRFALLSVMQSTREKPGQGGVVGQANP